MFQPFVLCVVTKHHLFFPGVGKGHRKLKLVNFEACENHISHETQGLSEKHLVVRRGKPFKVTLLFGGQSWNPHTERLVLEVWLGINKRIKSNTFKQKCVVYERKYVP